MKKIPYLTLGILLTASTVFADDYFWRGSDGTSGTVTEWDGATNWFDGSIDGAWLNDGTASARFDASSGGLSSGSDTDYANNAIELTSDVNLTSLVFDTGKLYYFTGTGAFNFGTASGLIDTHLAGTGVRFRISNNITGSGGLTITGHGDTGTGAGGVGHVLLSGDNSNLTGGITITSGLVNFTKQEAAGSNVITINGGGLVNSSAVTLANAIAVGTSGGTIRVYGGGGLTLSGELSGSGAITKTDTGTVVLSGANASYTGKIIIAAGTLQYAQNGATDSLAGGGDILVNSGGNLRRDVGGTNYNLTNNLEVNGGTITVNTTQGSTSVVRGITYTGTLAGSGFTKAGSGGFTLSGDNSGYSGAITITGGVLGLTSANSAGGAKITISADGAGLFKNMTGALTITNEIITNANARMRVYDGSTNNLILAGKVTGTGSLTVTDNGALTLAADNDYAGTTTMSGTTANSILQVGNGGTTGTLGQGAVVITNANATLRFNRTDGYAVTNSIGGAGKVQIMGGGKFTFAGASTYTGGTTVTSGTLVATNASALGHGAVVIAANGILEIDAGITLTGITSLTVNSGGTIAFTDGSMIDLSAGTLTLTDLTLNLVGMNLAAGNLNINDLFGTPSTTITESMIDNIVLANGYSYTWVDGSNGIISVVIPEPSTYALLGALGAAGLVVLRRRKKR